MKAAVLPWSRYKNSKKKKKNVRRQGYLSFLHVQETKRIKKKWHRPTLLMEIKIA